MLFRSMTRSVVLEAAYALVLDGSILKLFASSAVGRHESVILRAEQNGRMLNKNNGGSGENASAIITLKQVLLARKPHLSSV